MNPILDWDRSDPTNRNKWFAQQGLLKDFDPPYVYNVFKGDKEGFLRAIKDAMEHPIERSPIFSRSVCFSVINSVRRYILPRMRMGAVEQRLGDILERDWKEEARVLLKQRQESGEEPVRISTFPFCGCVDVLCSYSKFEEFARPLEICEVRSNIRFL